MPPRSPTGLTERERIVLAYMDELLFASAAQLGRHIYDTATDKGGSNLASIGAAVVGRLRKRGLVAYLPDCGMWRITPAGRLALKEKTK